MGLSRSSWVLVRVSRFKGATSTDDFQQNKTREKVTGGERARGNILEGSTRMTIFLVLRSLSLAFGPLGPKLELSERFFV